MSYRNRVLIVVALCLLGTAISAILLQQHHGESFGSGVVATVCGSTESGCDVVNRSSYSAVAGFPVAALGIVFYLSLAALALLASLSGDRGASAGLRVGVRLVGAALAVDLVLLAIQAFVLKTFCTACLFTYALNAALFLVLLRPQPATPAESGLLDWPEGRALVGGWLLASLLLAGLAWSGEKWLTARESRRAAGILGPPVRAAQGSEDLAALRAEVTRLQQILDDPAKRQRYDTDKALGEFESAPVVLLDLSHTPFEGPANAPISVVEFSDFLCPFCRNIAGAFQSYLHESGGRVKVYFKHFPLDRECNTSLQQTVHAGACRLARGAVCANEQGKFWPYHYRVFGTELQNPQASDVVQIATRAGLDAARFQTCLDSPASAERVRQDVAEGQRIGVQATPTLLVNGKRLTRVNDFLEIVNREAKRLGLPEAPPPLLTRPPAESPEVRKH